MIKKPIRIISTQEKSTLQMRFFPTDICNFDCGYCFGGSGNIGKYRYPKNIDTVINNFRVLFDRYSEKLGKTKFELALGGGGEPTLWPHIDTFCREIKKSHNVKIIIATNGSRTLRWWKDNSACFDDVVLGTHNEFVDVEHQCAVGDLLHSAGVKVTGFVLMDAMNWDKCVSIVEQMKQSKQSWIIETKAVVDAPGRGMDVYTEEQLDYLKFAIKRVPDGETILKRFPEMKLHECVVLFTDDSASVAKGNDIIVNKWNFFYGWNCDVALETLFINYDGSLKGSCQEPIFSGKEFNVFSEDFAEYFNLDIEFKPIRCPRVQCNCQGETYITKVKS